MPKVVVYLRVSTDEQADSGLGLEAQLAARTAFAEQHRWDVDQVHRDEGISGGKGIDQQPGLVGAIAALEPGDTLLVMKRDRIARGDPVMVAMIDGAVRKQGGKTVSTAGEGTEDDSPGSILFRRMIDAFGEYELLLIRARTRAALAAKRARGERAESVPYGRRLGADGRTLEVDPAEEAALGSIRQWKGEGLSLRAIARRLDEAGVPTKGGRPWRHTTVKELLRRPIDAEACQE